MTFNSNTPRLYRQWLNSVIYSLTNHWAEACVAIWRCSEVSTTLDGVTSFFSCQQRRKCMKTSALQSKLLSEFLYSMAESWKNLKDTFTFSSFSMC